MQPSSSIPLKVATTSELHRIYWQHDKGDDSSAAVRITAEAKAQDVTNLLRETLKTQNNDTGGNDSLVLVGTLQQAVQFETNLSAKKQPFFIIHTLAPLDSPLQIRQKMQEKLIQQSRNNSEEMKIKWYFVPAYESPNLKLDEDGYSTCMESDDEVEFAYDNERNNSSTADTHFIIDKSVTFPWLSTQEQSIKPANAARLRHKRRHAELSHCRETETGIISGFLLKQSLKDSQVWRKVYCVLSDDYLWFISRIHSHGKYSKLGRIRLTHALLIGNNDDLLNFEIIASNSVHAFKSVNNTSWNKAISDRIVESFENDVLRQTNVIVAEKKLIDSAHFEKQVATAANNNNTRLAIRVYRYRKLCMYIIQSMNSSSEYIKHLIDETWQLARDLYDSIVANTREQKPGGALHTICRHVDYVILGSHRKNVSVIDPPPVDLFDNLLKELQKQSNKEL